MFTDRQEAGAALAQSLQSYKGKDVVVLAIPRGGLPLGAIIAKELNAPLDVAITKKLGHPQNPEYAVGALNKDTYVINPEAHVSQGYLDKEIKRVQKLVNERYDQYYSIARPHDLKNKWVIIVDDGVATGSTVLATVQLASKKEPAGIVVATPVAPPRIIEKLKNSPFIDEVVCLDTPPYFMGVGQFYENFSPVSDEEAITILEKANQKPPSI